MTFHHQPARRPLRQRAASATRMAALRATFRVLDVAAPQAAAHRAMRLWCTLPGNPGRRRDLRPGPGSTSRLDVPGGGDIVVETWGEGPVVYLVPGWGGWRGQLGAFVAPLVTAGYRVVGFDAPGHGDSSPGHLGAGRGSVMEIIEGLQVVTRAYGPAHGLVAHSLGCTAAVAVLRAGLGAQRLVLVAPNDGFVPITREFARALGFTERTRGRLEATIEGYCGRSLSSFDLGPAGPGMPATLVVHDRQDKETPFDVGARVADAWPSATLLATDGLGHQRILADAGVVAQVVGHLVGVAAPEG